MTIIIVSWFTWKFISLCAHFFPRKHQNKSREKGLVWDTQHTAPHTSGICFLLQLGQNFSKDTEKENFGGMRSSSTGPLWNRKEEKKTDNRCECAETQSCSMAITTRCLAQLTVWEKRSQRVLFSQTKDKRQERHVQELHCQSSTHTVAYSCKIDLAADPVHDPYNLLITSNTSPGDVVIVSQT